MASIRAVIIWMPDKMTGGGLFQTVNDGTTPIGWVFSLFLDLVRKRLENPNIRQAKHISHRAVAIRYFPIYICYSIPEAF